MVHRTCTSGPAPLAPAVAALLRGDPERWLPKGGWDTPTGVQTVLPDLTPELRPQLPSEGKPLPTRAQGPASPPGGKARLRGQPQTASHLTKQSNQALEYRVKIRPFKTLVAFVCVALGSRL